MIIALQIIGGLILLFAGGEILVRGAVALARHFGIPKLIIGLTIVAIGTSAPEILVSVKAALSDHADIAIGNVVGSNISNILLVMGLTAMVSAITIHNSVIKRDAPILLAISMLFIAFCWTGKEISMLEGLVLLACLITYTLYTIKTAKLHKDEHLEDELPPDTTNFNAILFVFGGIAALALGADILVDGAVSLASMFGMSEAVIGLTIVAVGSSTPELATCIIAARRNHVDIVAGNIVGSNLLNIMAGISIPALIAPLPIAAQFFTLDLWIMLAATILLYIMMRVRKNISRITGIVFFLGYISYIVTLAILG